MAATGSVGIPNDGGLEIYPQIMSDWNILRKVHNPNKKRIKYKLVV